MQLAPKQIESEAAWLGSEMAQLEHQWRWTLGPEDIALLEQAAEQFISSGKPLANMTCEDFNVGGLNAQLAQFKSQLIKGRGFGLISGLKLDSYTLQERATLFMGVGAHIGLPRSQNADGHLLGHVRDINRNASDPNARIYQTANRQTFHTDSCDVVGLLCNQPAKAGGESLLVSSESIYNVMNEQNAALATLLFDSIATDKRGEVEKGALPFFTIPVFSWYDNKLTTIYQRQYIDSAQRFEEAPRLTDRHIAALDLFDSLADNEHLHFSMKLEKGDMQFVHNHNLLHDRNSFEDWPEDKYRRHLYRLWLSVPGARALPDYFAQRYGSVKVGDRGGVIVEGATLHVPLN